MGGNKGNESVTREERYNINSAHHNNSTKLLVPRNGTNEEESKNIENRRNLLYNIDYVI